MDPLTALGIAANIAQFIDFGATLVKQAKEVAGTGSSISVSHLSTITSDLVETHSSLKQQLKPITKKKLNLTKEEQVRDKPRVPNG
jgi:hypothetical protein